MSLADNPAAKFSSLMIFRVLCIYCSIVYSNISSIKVSHQIILMAILDLYSWYMMWQLLHSKVRYFQTVKSNLKISILNYEGPPKFYLKLIQKVLCQTRNSWISTLTAIYKWNLPDMWLEAWSLSAVSLPDTVIKDCLILSHCLKSKGFT